MVIFNRFMFSQLLYNKVPYHLSQTDQSTHLADIMFTSEFTCEKNATGRSVRHYSHNHGNYF